MSADLATCCRLRRLSRHLVGPQTLQHLAGPVEVAARRQSDGRGMQASDTCETRVSGVHQPAEPAVKETHPPPGTMGAGPGSGKGPQQARPAACALCAVPG